MTKIVGLLILCFGLASCQSFIGSKKNCRIESWALLGKRDVLNGHPSSRFFERIQACGSDNYEEAFELYNQGYNAQKIDYCTSDGGYKVGLYNRNYSGICTSLNEAFLASYQKGLLAYQIKKKIARDLHSYSQIMRQVSSQKAQLRYLSHQYKLSQNMSVNGLIAKEIATQKNYIDELSDELYFLDKALQKHQQNLKNIEKLD